MTDAIEAQVERFAPGFRDLVLARAVTTPADFEARNRNLVGGDINGGTMDLAPAASPRPVASLVPVPDAAPGRLPLLAVDAARRRRPRDVRLLGGAGGARGDLALRARSLGMDRAGRRPRSPIP